MTTGRFKLLEETFDLPNMSNEMEQSTEILDQVNKIEQQLESTPESQQHDQEMDDLAVKAIKTFDDLVDLGMNVEARVAAPIFEAATKLLGHAITAKTNKLDKKLRLIDLELKKKRLEHQINNKDESTPDVEGSGRVLDRNELLKILKQKD